MSDAFAALTSASLSPPPRLKPKNTEKVLQEYGNRARKLEGQKLDLDDFAQFLDVPVSDMLRDMFALFDEVDAAERNAMLHLVCFAETNTCSHDPISKLLTLI